MAEARRLPPLTSPSYASMIWVTSPICGIRIFDRLAASSTPNPHLTFITLARVLLKPGMPAAKSGE
jgi:hypothetical protein